MSDLPDHVDGLADPGAPDLVAWVRASFDAVRGEVATLVASLDLQNEQVARLARAEHEAVGLARTLPDRIGEAIAAAIDAQRNEMAPQSERVIETFRASLREIKAELGELTSQMGDQHRVAAGSADRVAIVADTVQSSSARVDDHLERLEELVTGVPGQTAETLDDHLVPVRERLDRLGEDLTRLAARDTAGDVRADIQAIPGSVDATVRDVVAEVVATSLADLREALDAMAASVPDSVTGRIAPQLDRVGREATGARADTSEAIARLSEQIDAMAAQAGRSASEATATLAEELRVEVTDALGEVRRAINELVARDPVATAEVRELNDAVTARLDLLGAQMAKADSAGVARVEASLDELRSSIGRIGQQLEAADADDDVGARLDGLARRLDALGHGIGELGGSIEAIGHVETVHRAIAELDERLSAIAADEGPPLDELQASVQRLAAVIRELGAREDTAVTSRLERLHEAVEQLTQRPDPTDRLDDIAAQLAQRPDPTDRLDDIAAQLTQRPDPTDRLDDIAAQLAQRPDPTDRLEEVASRVAQLDWIAAGLGTLTERIDELGERSGSPDLGPQLDAIGEELREQIDAVRTRIDELTPAAAPDLGPELTALRDDVRDQLAAVGDRIARLSEREEPDDLGPQLDAITARLEGLATVADVAAAGSQAADARSASQRSAEEVTALVERVDQRLTELANRIDEQPDEGRDLVELAERIDDLGKHLGEQLGELATSLRVVEAREPAGTEQIGARLDELSNQMETAVNLLRRIRRPRPLQAKRKAAAEKEKARKSASDEG